MAFPCHSDSCASGPMLQYPKKKNQDKSKEQLIYKMLKQPQGENSETEADCSSRTERGWVIMPEC